MIVSGSAQTSLYAGSISGTSVDGLDLALLEMGGQIRFVAAATKPFPDSLRQTLLALGQPENDGIDAVGSADRALGEFIAEALLEFLEEQGISAGQVSAFGSHGQTVRHRPDAEHPFTWQIGDPNVIAERTGITTVADFRRRDMAAGGQGAPLVPPFHEALFGADGEARAVLNIGGISNLTLLPATTAHPVSGFDCGPGNALLDSWCARHRSRPYDENAEWASTGRLLDRLLRTLLEDPYLQREPPKSTGREYYNLEWLAPRLSSDDRAAADVQRTLLEFTAVSISQAMTRWCAAARRLIVCGGGRLNPLLMARLNDLLAIPVEPVENLGFDGDAIEAAAFAWLAHRRMAGLAGSAASVTGASGDRVLGAVYPGGNVTRTR